MNFRVSFAKGGLFLIAFFLQILIMSAFRFQQFQIEDNKSTMKVGTDAVLLGIWTKIHPNCRNILDIGSGCGVISLMLAQKCDAHILGIDIDKNSIQQARQNAEISPWNKRVNFEEISLQNFCQPVRYQSFDIIVSNPPFFVNSLHSPHQGRNLSRHTDTLPYAALAKGVAYCLKKEGVFYTVLPTQSADILISLLQTESIFLQKCLQILSYPSAPPKRVLLCFSKEYKPLQTETFTLRHQNREFTDEYIQFTKEYYLW